MGNVFGGLRPAFRPRWVGYLVALGSVALVSLLIALLASWGQVANASMLYLIAVLLTATAFGSGPAVLASAAAVLTYEWFFVEPLGSIAFTRPEQWMEFLLFLMTAIVTGQLAVGQRQRARQAEQGERDAKLLHDLMRLMSDPDIRHALAAVAERLRQEFQLHRVVIDLSDAMSVRTRVEAAAPMDAESGVRGWNAAVAPETSEAERPPAVQQSGPAAASNRLRVVQVIAQGDKVGYILLVGGESRAFYEAEERLLSAAVSQLSLAVERARLRQEATETEILRRTDELKTALLNAVSHELRTPLASIIASAGSLLEGDVDWSDGERQEFAEAIEQEARRLDRLVGNLLDLSRLRSGSLQPQKEWYDLGALVDDVLGRLRVTTARHTIRIDIPDDLPPVHLDYVKIDHALSNLVENAARYSPAGTEILVSVDVDGDEVKVEVADEGPGIPDEDLTRIFEPFFRSSTNTARPKGTGLGLAVARGMVEAHGGRILAENRSGGGASFLFRLPVHNPS